MNQTELRNHIREAEDQLKQLQRKVARLEQYITAGKRLLSKETDDDDAAVPKRKMRRNALAAKIKPLLSGGALHVSEIVTRLEETGTDLSKSKNKEATVASALIRRPEDFERVAPNKFALRSKAA